MELSNKIEGALWYEFDQNNSGGYYERDDFVADVVFIQAMSSDQADDIMRDMVDKAHAWNYCECCGERWSFWRKEGYEVPTRYDEDVTKGGFELYSKDGYALFHGLNGRTLKWNGRDTPIELGKLSDGV